MCALLLFLIISVAPSHGVDDGAGPSCPVMDDPAAIRAAAMSNNIAKCETTIAKAGAVLMDSHASGEALHSAYRAREEVVTRLWALDAQLQLISTEEIRDPPTATHRREVEGCDYHQNGD